MRDFLNADDLPEDSLGHVFVNTEETVSMFQAFDDLLTEPRTATTGKGVAVLGLPRCGKTSIIREYLLRCGEGSNDGLAPGVPGRKPVKYLYVPLTPGTRLNTIPSQTLNALGHPSPNYGRHDTVQTGHVIQEVTEEGYELIIFDEIHHLVNSETRRVRENGSHWLTHVLDATRCPMILVGYSAFKEILSENGFLGGRLAPTRPMRAYDVNDPVSVSVFKVILRGFEEALRLPQPSNLADAGIAERILVTCGGRVGLVENFLTHARTLVRRRGYSCIRPDILLQAAEDVRNTWCSLRFNPFEVEDLKVAAGMHGETFSLPQDGPKAKERGK